MENLELRNETGLAPVMSVKDWAISIIITMIPLVGLIILCIWAFGNKEINENKKNWAKALVFIQIATIIIVGIIYAIIIAAFLAVYQTR